MKPPTAPVRARFRSLPAAARTSSRRFRRAATRSSSTRPTSASRSTTRTGRCGRAARGSTRRRTSGSQRVEVTVTDRTKTIDGRRGARRPRRRDRGRRGRRGHVRLVRPGRGREHLVPRRGHDGVRGRQGRSAPRARGRRASTARWPGSSLPADPEVGMAYRQEYYEGEAEDRGEGAERRRARGRPVRHLRRRPRDRGHDAARAGVSSSTSSTPRTSARCSTLDGLEGRPRTRGADQLHASPDALRSARWPRRSIRARTSGTST